MNELIDLDSGNQQGRYLPLMLQVVRKFCRMNHKPFCERLVYRIRIIHEPIEISLDTPWILSAKSKREDQLKYVNNMIIPVDLYLYWTNLCNCFHPSFYFVNMLNMFLQSPNICTRIFNIVWALPLLRHWLKTAACRKTKNKLN